jgi:NADP-dependent 3-hydroxy acid dehydrogenase YdfG
MQELIQSKFADRKVKKFEIKVYFVVSELFSTIIKHGDTKKVRSRYMKTTIILSLRYMMTEKVLKPKN